MTLASDVGHWQSGKAQLETVSEKCIMHLLQIQSSLLRICCLRADDAASIQTYECGHNWIVSGSLNVQRAPSECESCISSRSLPRIFAYYRIHFVERIKLSGAPGVSFSAGFTYKIFLGTPKFENYFLSHIQWFIGGNARRWKNKTFSSWLICMIKT